MNNKTTITILIIAALIIGSFFLATRSTSTTLPVPTTTDSTTSAPHETLNPGTVPTPIPTTPGTTKTTFTMADVKTHNTAASCFTAISGSVYDVTTWINQHPGGSRAILSLCGTDGTSAFTDQHGGQARPAEELAGFKIGTVVVQ